MQKLIAKYGCAAHLAILAVAPLFLFPFCNESVISTVVLWLSLSAVAWVFLEPSLRNGETLHEARRRVVKSTFRDSLFWASLVQISFTGVRALNTGIDLSYDVEVAKWSIASANFPILPGSVAGHGYLPFATSVALAILLQGCRHSLGRSARMAFLLLSSSLAGVAAVVAISLAFNGNEVCIGAMKCLQSADSYVGLVFSIYLFSGIVALMAAFENRWNFMMPFFAFAVGGTAAGVFVFSPAYESGVIAVCVLILLVYTFAFACKALRTSGEFKLLVVSGISMTLGGLLVVALMPESIFPMKIAAYRSLDFLPEKFLAVRKMLSAIALKTWQENLWTGTGLGSFPFVFRFNALADDWALVPSGVRGAANGWMTMLTERGIIGLVMALLPFGFIVFTYVRRMIGGIVLRRIPHPACLIFPLALALIVMSGFFNNSLFRGDVVIALGAVLSISANSFPRMKRKNHG